MESEETMLEPSFEERYRAALEVDLELASKMLADEVVRAGKERRRTEGQRAEEERLRREKEDYERQQFLEELPGCLGGSLVFLLVAFAIYKFVFWAFIGTSDEGSSFRHLNSSKSYDFGIPESTRKEKALSYDSDANSSRIVKDGRGGYMILSDYPLDRDAFILKGKANTRYNSAFDQMFQVKAGITRTPMVPVQLEGGSSIDGEEVFVIIGVTAGKEIGFPLDVGVNNFMINKTNDGYVIYK